MRKTNFWPPDELVPSSSSHGGGSDRKALSALFGGWVSSRILTAKRKVKTSSTPSPHEAATHDNSFLKPKPSGLLLLRHFRYGVYTAIRPKKRTCVRQNPDPIVRTV